MAPFDAGTWFGDRNALLAADGTAVRVLLPLALWIAFVAVVGAAPALVAAPTSRALRRAARGGAGRCLALLLTVLGNRWPGWTQAILGSVRWWRHCCWQGRH